MAPAQLFGWRSKAIKSGAVTPQRDADRLGFVEVTQAASSTVEICLGDVVIRAGADVGQDHLARIIRAVRQATGRQEKSAAIVAALFALREKELPKLSGKSKPAEAIRYALGRRAVLERFLADGRIELDYNTVERAIRLQTRTGRPHPDVADI